MNTASQLHIDLSEFAGTPIAVLGLGKSGLSAARALHESGAEVRAWDDDAARREAAQSDGMRVVDLATADMADVPTLLLSPGIPHTHPAPHPAVTQALAAGCEIVCDIELLARADREAFYVGITGTNGKSTTTALIGHMLNRLGVRAVIGGNIGEPALTLAPMGDGGVYVLELSSYQLELLTSATFDVAILLNISPDHLDRHGGMAGYIAAKRRIFARQAGASVAIIGIDGDDSRAIYDDLVAQQKPAVAISVERPVAGGVYVSDGWLIDDRGDTAKPIINLADVETLPGPHNAQNAAVAYAAVSMIIAGDIVGDATPIATAIATFPGLAHRQELVTTIDGCRFVNDSKATNAEATARALACNENIIWIVGGRAKAGGIEALAPFFSRIRHAFLIGEAADDFAQTLDGQVPYTLSGDLVSAVADAAELARSNSEFNVVLLSPACASFDQFPNFEARGEAFRTAVMSLSEDAA
ncbi:MAG: UDP-N-acetylmuramoyl-L-alanine--D-glutamate ligase [Alphaproteobacteria bacterium]|nr:UDP-N-acetylmuramoyl-L-alanine--D-glutamate ligase [Alphaproteobacteria bacterium]